MGNIFGSDYLKEPITEKNSTDEENDKLNCGTSTMQGWRLSQEDAHNCILDYDKDKSTSYFAVYDGHGGRAVAIYCSEQLPNFLKELEDFKNGKIEKALEEAFLKFDSSLTTDEIMQKIKELSGEDLDVESEDEENINNLYEEASMPLEKVIEKYTSNPDLKMYLKKRKLLDDSKSEDENNSPTSTTSCALEKKSEDNSSNENSKLSKEANDIKSETPKDDAPDSQQNCTSTRKNSTETEVSDQNGDIESKIEPESPTSNVSSSSTPQENGDVLKKGKGKALAKTKGVVPKTKILPSRTARQIYDAILSLAEGSEEEESEDDKDETFEGPNDDSSDEGDNEAAPDVDDNSSSSDDEEEDDAGDGEEGEDEEAEDDDDEEGESCGYRPYEDFSNPIKHCGCTAVVAVLKGNDLYVANAGDSRCIVSRNGDAIEMSIDHKPLDEIEEARIIKAGGFVSRDNRVNGGLNLSRAIGDHGYKQNDKLSDREQMITALPDVKTLKINPDEDEFMVLACDGIWNSMVSQEVVDFVRPKIQNKMKLSKICEEMFEHCLAPSPFCDGTGCDNMTAIIVQFKSANEKRSTSAEPEETNPHKKMKTDEAKTEAVA